MNPVDHLAAALKAVDWEKNIAEFLKHARAPSTIAAANLRLALWSKEFEQIEKGNPALSFIRSMQAAGHQVAALLSLGLYNAAAGSIRQVFESALYYTYFRRHPAELATLVTSSTYYATKQEVIDYHKLHSSKFSECEKKLGLVAKLGDWYKSTSAVVHGQIPGTWISHKGLAEISFHRGTLEVAVSQFELGEELVHHLFLCTSGREVWHDVSTSAKKKLVSGLSGDVKTTLKLDTA